MYKENRIKEEGTKNELRKQNRIEYNRGGHWKLCFEKEQNSSVISSKSELNYKYSILTTQENCESFTQKRHLLYNKRNSGHTSNNSRKILTIEQII